MLFATQYKVMWGNFSIFHREITQSQQRTLSFAKESEKQIHPTNNDKVINQTNFLLFILIDRLAMTPS